MDVSDLPVVHVPNVKQVYLYDDGEEVYVILTVDIIPHQLFSAYLVNEDGTLGSTLTVGTNRGTFYHPPFEYKIETFIKMEV
jgi:hypothetical protein